MRDEPPKVKLNFRISSRVFEKMQALVDTGEYEDTSDVIVSAIHQLLEKSENKTVVEEAVIRYLDSEKGHETIHNLLLAEYLRPGITGRSPNAVAEPEPEYPKRDETKRRTKARTKNTR